ncbi:MAG: ferritin-like domain-containing protein [Acidobacteria bacterium]|nr:ferritin-like domain-containing protein [Acidobacteriota bacterium]
MIPLRLELPELHQHHRLQRLLDSRVPEVGLANQATDRGPLWPASFFQLDRSQIFQEATVEERSAILAGCSRAILEEAFWIEKCGMYFAPKMALMAESLETQMLYCQFAAEEATHFQLISQFLGLTTVSSPSENPFVTFLAQILETESPAVLQFLIQVVLEGWGIAHYRNLAKACLMPDFGGVLERILKDEARHHGSGVVLCSERMFAAPALDRIAEIVMVFLRMIQIGPVMVLGQVEQVKGHLSLSQKSRLYCELDAEESTLRKLRLIQNLIRAVPATSNLVETLDAKGCFTPGRATFGDSLPVW